MTNQKLYLSPFQVPQHGLLQHVADILTNYKNLISYRNHVQNMLENQKLLKMRVP